MGRWILGRTEAVADKPLPTAEKSSLRRYAPMGLGANGPPSDNGLMVSPSVHPPWSLVTPLLGLGVLALGVQMQATVWLSALQCLALIGCVLASVHHAEVLAHRLGEPLGTFILAVAITVIEVGLIVSLMMSAGPGGSALARDTVFAAIMLILNGIVGLCLLLGGTRHGEQTFGLYGVSASLAVLAAIAVLTLVLPNYTTSVPGPFYSSAQLAFIAIVTLVLYGTFTLVQTVRHRDYFLAPDAPHDEQAHAPIPSNRNTALAAGLLMAALIAVVLLGKALAPSIEGALVAVGAPRTLLGVVIAAVVLMPEAWAAVRAARANRLQTSLNLAIGSALASIGLTIPAVALVALLTGWPLALGIDIKSTVLLMLSLMVATLSLGTGRTTVLQGAVHLVICAVYVFTIVVP